MPNKHNENQHHKIKKSRYKYTNWHPDKTGASSRPQLYSDIALETTVFIRQVFPLPLRQTEGFMKSIARIMKADIIIPDFSSNSKRCINIAKHLPAKAAEPAIIFFNDSNGLKV
jgi:hypothetical protein